MVFGTDETVLFIEVSSIQECLYGGVHTLYIRRSCVHLLESRPDIHAWVVYTMKMCVAKL